MRPLLARVDFLAIAFDPGQFAQIVFVVHRLYLHGMGPFF